MTDIKTKFSEFTKAGYFSRVDNTHILNLHIGLDDTSQKAIELRSKFTPVKVIGTSAIEVNQYTKPEYNTIRFSLCDEEVSGLFYLFCKDLIEQTRTLTEDSDGYQSIIKRFFQWKRMFVASKKDYLTEPEIMGLIGEILFMRDFLSEEVGISKALECWSGQELTHKDFSREHTWYEVKTIGRSNQNVKISSLEQLDSDNEGELVVLTLERMSPAYKGISLNRLIIDTIDKFVSEDDKNIFLTKVALQGYEYNNYYDDYVYELCSVVRYLVDERFPKLTRKNIPLAIRKASYDISLTDIKEFEKSD